MKKRDDPLYIYSLLINTTMKKKSHHVSCLTCSSRLKSVFCDISEEDILHVNQFKGRYTYPKGSIIFHRETLPLGVFVIEKGKVKLHVPAVQGRDQIVRMAGEGDIIGHRALLTDRPHSTTAEAIEETHVCFLSKDLFYRLYGNNKGVHAQLIALFAGDLISAERSLISASHKPVKARVAECLLFLKDKFGYGKENNILNITLSRQDLSSLAGTATETLIRNLIRMREEGLIDFQGKKIKLTDIKRLQQTAAGHC